MKEILSAYRKLILSLLTSCSRDEKIAIRRELLNLAGIIATGLELQTASAKADYLSPPPDFPPPIHGFVEI